MKSIGIDLDNTIIDYNPFFKKFLNKKIIVKSDNYKTEVKNNLIKLDNGEQKWMKLQGKAYGESINQAVIFQGFINFLIISKQKKIKITIVSHKTEYGHYNKKKFNLRKCAMDYLKKNLIFNNIEYFDFVDEIFFFNTFEEKIKFINSQNYDFFIDDLPKVIKSIKIKNKILFNYHKKIFQKDLFCLDHWDQITNLIFNNKSSILYKKLVNFKTKLTIKSIKKIKSNRNSQVYKLLDFKRKTYFLKVYPSRGQNINNDLLNIDREVLALNFFKKKGIKNTPLLYHFDNDSNFIITSWLSGSKKRIVNDHFLKCLLSFIKDIFNKSKSLNSNDFKNFPLAKDAVLNFSDLLIDIEKRIFLFKKNKKTIPIEIIRIIKEVEYCFKHQTKICKQYIKKTNFHYNVDLNKQILSPSDMGMHNCILKNSSFHFYDFEYFGRDDPVKLLCDIILNPYTFKNLDKLDNFFSNYSNMYNDNTFFKRYKLTFRLHLLKWILIILKKYSLSDKRKYFSINDKQYKKSKDFLAKFKNFDSSLFLFSDIS